MSLPPGSKRGPYEIIALIGKGGMGEVYRAHDPRMGRDVAIKISAEHFSDRFTREVRAVAALNHPNICTLHDVGSDYLVMELLDGATLRDRLRDGPLDLNTALELAIQIADGVHAAHEKGILHRDIKPANIMITGRGHVKILDFGLAKRFAPDDPDKTETLDTLTERGAAVGTLHYMPPEVLRGEPADTRSDLWAMGVVLYEMVTGQRPFRGQTAFALSSAILREPAVLSPAQAPAAVRSAIERCLAKNPDDRYQHASQLRAALEAALPNTAAGRRTPSRRVWLWAAAGAVALAAAGVVWRNPGLQWRKSGAELTTTGGPRSKNADANDFFERAMQYVRNQDDLPRAFSMLDRALEVDPKFAEARRWRGFCQVLMVDSGRSNDTSWLYRAQEELAQAAKDDPTLATIHSAWAALYYYQGRLELGRNEISKALQINPNETEALSWLLSYDLLEGDYAEGLALADRMIEREPLFTPARWSRAEILREQGDYARAAREMETALEQAPQSLYTLITLALVYLDAGELMKARAILERGRGIDAKNFQVRISWATLLAAEGNRTEALQEMDAEVLKFVDLVPAWTSQAAEVYALAGDSSKALDWLDKAVLKGDDRAEWFRRNPLLASVRQQSRFQQIVASIDNRRKQRLKQ